MKYLESKIFIILTCLALVLVILNLSACTETNPSQGSATEASAEVEAVQIPAQKVANEQKEYPPVFNGPRIKENDPVLNAANTATEITQAIYSDSPNRVFRKAFVKGDSVKFQMVEDWDYEGKVWQFDYAQTGGDFSALAFPQIGKGDQVYELQREYSLKAGKIFHVREVIFARRADQSEVLHRNHYVFDNAKLVSWYRDQERYEINERFYEITQNLFPQIDRFDFHAWINSTFKAPEEVIGTFGNLQGVGPNLREALDNWIAQAKAMEAMIVEGKVLAGDDSSQPVIWLEFGPGRNAMGAAFVLEWGEGEDNIEVYDPMEIGIAYIRPELCQSAGDVVATLAWARQEERRSVLMQLLDPENGLLYGGMEELSNAGQTDAKTLMPDDLQVANMPNPLYFGSFEGPSGFDENGFATWQWTLPGSSETMIIQKTEERLYWRAFKGAYH
ncbi:MAG: hypothetical protein AAFN10_15235 [Bacteroidota bacterium]